MSSLLPPSPLSASGAGGVTLSWGAVSGATGYSVYLGMASGGDGSTLVNASPVGGTTYADSGSAAGTPYYVMQAVNGDILQGLDAQAHLVAPDFNDDNLHVIPNYDGFV